MVWASSWRASSTAGDTVTHVYSHEQGLFQCERYLNAHPAWKQVPQADTAGSAKMVAGSGGLGQLVEGVVHGRVSRGPGELQEEHVLPALPRQGPGAS